MGNSGWLAAFIHPPRFIHPSAHASNQWREHWRRGSQHPTPCCSCFGGGGAFLLNLLLVVVFPVLFLLLLAQASLLSSSSARKSTRSGFTGGVQLSQARCCGERWQRLAVGLQRCEGAAGGSGAFRGAVCSAHKRCLSRTGVPGRARPRPQPSYLRCGETSSRPATRWSLRHCSGGLRFGVTGRSCAWPPSLQTACRTQRGWGFGVRVRRGRQRSHAMG